ncbi:MAG: ribokinase [Bacteroidales bacterium]|nr:ribokinase [Bacteroidales bacterium]
MKRILVVGSSNTDLIIKVPEIPRPGETLLGGQFQTFPGGKGANQAVAAARSGGDVVFIASVGDDAYGKEAVRGYKLDNINTENVKICKNIPSGIAMITISDNGENAITVAPGANSKLLPADLDEAEEAFHETDYMLVQLETPIETVKKAVDLCVEFNTSVILNPAPAAELPDEILSAVDIITPNETEAERLTGIKVTDEHDASSAATRLHERGVNTVIITMGAQGAYLSDQATGIGVLIRGFKVEAVDTTAAGDVFNGQLAVALAEGKSFQNAILIAHSAAALSVQKLGAQSSIPRREETDYYLEEKLKS